MDQKSYNSVEYRDENQEVKTPHFQSDPSRKNHHRLSPFDSWKQVFEMWCSLWIGRNKKKKKKVALTKLSRLGPFYWTVLRKDPFPFEFLDENVMNSWGREKGDCDVSKRKKKKEKEKKLNLGNGKKVGRCWVFI